MSTMNAMDARDRALADADDVIERLKAERDLARAQLAERTQADAREAAETVAAAQAAVAELDAEAGTLRDQIRELEEACEARDRRIVELARERAEVITDLVTADRKIAALREHLAARDRRVAELEAAAPRETSATIAAWADQTFGAPESNMSIFRRAAKEFHELLEKLEVDDNHPHAAAECADVCIVLDRMVHRLGKDMVQERDEKMRINRARTWRTTGDGHGQHVDVAKEQG